VNVSATGDGHNGAGDLNPYNIGPNQITITVTVTVGHAGEHGAVCVL
jgi:hypothetical protein